ncbi:hypothetical protein OG308_32435 [Nocardia salmonicida]|uniref:Integral membrane protein n=1 Tax=Nocardia salmonicida TaxID=53431 RepID=A0ABZ1N7I2_9NOCA
MCSAIPDASTSVRACEGGESLPDDTTASPLDAFRDGEPPPRRTNADGPVIWSASSVPTTRPAKGPSVAPPRPRRPPMSRPASARTTPAAAVPDDVASAIRRARGPAPLPAAQRAKLRRRARLANGTMHGHGVGGFLTDLVLWAVVCNVSYLLVWLWRFDVQLEWVLRDNYLEHGGWLAIACSVVVAVLFRNRNTCALFAVAYGPLVYGAREVSLRADGEWGTWAPWLVLAGSAVLARLLTAWFESVATDRLAYRRHVWQQAANERRRH